MRYPFARAIRGREIRDLIGQRGAGSFLPQAHIDLGGGWREGRADTVLWWLDRQLITYFGHREDRIGVEKLLACEIDEYTLVVDRAPEGKGGDPSGPPIGEESVPESVIDKYRDESLAHGAALARRIQAARGGFDDDDAGEADAG